MKFNILYLFLMIALLGIFWIKENFEHQNVNVFFGTAETDERELSVDYDVQITALFVAVGDKVKAGDTLMLLAQPELDKEIEEKQFAIEQLQSQRSENTIALRNEIGLLQSQYEAKKSELESEINVLRTEAAVQAQLRQAIGRQQNEAIKENQSYNQVQLQEIAVLEESIRQLQDPLKKQIQQSKQKQTGEDAAIAMQINQLNHEIKTLRDEKRILVLLAPIDGFVSDLPVNLGEMVQSFTTLTKLHSTSPAKIRGFIHESVDLAFKLGDTVSLSSSVRELPAVKGTLVSSSPQLVELPTRLRKFPEVRAWGREIYIQLPPNTPFYIGEKVMITMTNELSK
ncbi:MAG: hypothetical protein IPN33_02705 [Saprospiraceae bacterium]|nr:hypothetical protein [Saprospiraceae bacterium]